MQPLHAAPRQSIQAATSGFGSLQLLRQRAKKIRPGRAHPTSQFRPGRVRPQADWSLIFMRPGSAVENRWKRFTCLAEAWSLLPPLPHLTSGLAAPCQGSLHGGVFFFGALCAILIFRMD